MFFLEVILNGSVILDYDFILQMFKLYFSEFQDSVAWLDGGMVVSPIPTPKQPYFSLCNALGLCSYALNYWKGSKVQPFPNRTHTVR